MFRKSRDLIPTDNTEPEAVDSKAPGHSGPNTTVEKASIKHMWPGILATFAGGLAAWGISLFLPGISALLIAILLGALWRNVAPVPRLLLQGVAFSSKKILRTGIVLLGFQLSLSAITDLGTGVILIVVASVAGTFFFALWVGKLMGISFAQRMLIATGFSICGAAAVAATEGVTKGKQGEVATAIALVVLFGTLMIPTVPFLGGLLGLDDEALGLWIGASTHEVAQVVAAGGAVSSAALAVAVTVKLARVITLAPIIAGISFYMRRQGIEAGSSKPPIVPVFVIGFLIAMVIRTTGIVPEAVLSVIQIIQTLLLATAMFGLGLGVHIPSLFKVGSKPVVLGLLATVAILIISFSGIQLVSRF